MGRPHFSANVPYVEDIDELRLHVINEINRLAGVTSDQTFYSDVSANNNRLKELANPAGEYDAVNLHTLRREIDKAMKELYAKLHRPNLGKAFRYNDEEFEVVPGGFTIKGVDMTKAFNFDTDIFGNTVDFTILNEAIKEDHIAAGAVTTLKLTTQEINIGYGGNDMPVRLRIYDAANNPIAWIGDDSADHGGDTDYVGAWFKRVLFGGDGTMANMKAFADANGNFVLKSVWVYDALGTVGWIGHRQISSVDYYGGWFKELYIGGTDPASAKIYADGTGNVSIDGATFTLTANDITTTIDHSSYGGAYHGVRVSASTGPAYTSSITPTGFSLFNGSTQTRGYLYLDTATDAGRLALKDTNNVERVVLFAGAGAGNDSLYCYRDATIGGELTAASIAAQPTVGVYKLGVNTVIDASGNVSNLNNVTLGGNINATGYVNTSDVYKMDGIEIVNTSRQFTGGGIATNNGIGCTGLNIYTSYPSSYVNVIGSSGEIKPRYFGASSRPTLSDGEGAFWWDSANSKFYWLARVGSNYFKVEMPLA